MNTKITRQQTCPRDDWSQLVYLALQKFGTPPSTKAICAKQISEEKKNLNVPGILTEDYAIVQFLANAEN